MITIKLLDHTSFGANKVLGTFTVDVSYIYKLNPSHEVYRVWIPLTDSLDEEQTPMGYIQLSISILGPGDKPKVRDMRVLDKNDNGQMKLFMANRLKLTSYVMILRVYKAENLPPLDTHNYNIDPFVKICFAGGAAQTKKIEDNRNPEFNQELRLAFSRPTMNLQVRIEIWNDNPVVDDLVGTCYIDLKDDDSLNKFKPRYLNYYGPPLEPNNKEQS